MLIFWRKLSKLVLFFTSASKINRFSMNYFLQEHCFHCQFVKYMLILQFAVKKSIFIIKFWDWSALNLQNKLNKIFGPSCAKFYLNYHPWKHPKYVIFPTLSCKQHFLQPLCKHFLRFQTIFSFVWIFFDRRYWNVFAYFSTTS